ncbi:MAG: hypothetical protein K5656_07455 [Lachnospiraceae bacterium]|nr:hypothetical protein [Lachnospiraceae bacterium]
MSEELSTLLQVLQLYGRGLDGLGKAIRFTSRNVKKDVDFASPNLHLYFTLYNLIV